MKNVKFLPGLLIMLGSGDTILGQGSMSVGEHGLKFDPVRC